MGRPTGYTEALAREICDRIAEDEGLASICRSEHMPSRNTVYRWLREYEAFRDDYVRARVDQAETVADELREVRRKVEEGVLDPAAARVIMDSIKWEAGKRSPTVYGDKSSIDVKHTMDEEIAAWLGQPKS